MRNTIFAVIIGLSFASTAFSDAGSNTNKSFNLRVYGLAEQFEWKESVNGKELLKESGPLFGAGGELGIRLFNPIWFEGRGELYMGNVDYDGQIMLFEGGMVPYKSTTSYGGLKAEGDIAFKLPVSDGFYLKPYSGLGLRAWLRRLDKKLGKEMGQWGYEENWALIYGMIGCGGGVAVGEKGELFGRIEVRLPIKTTINSDYSNIGLAADVDTEPDGEPSVYAEAGLDFLPMTVSVFVETLKFSKSPVVVSGEHTYQQPDSESTTYGVKLGLAF